MSRNTADISGALELLREGLGPFVAREVQHRAPRDRIEKFISSKHRRVRDKLRNRPVFEWEVSILLDLMNQLWDNVFARTLEPMERNFVVELLSWRNNSAHQEPVDEDRFFDTAVRLLRAVEAETQAAEVARLRESRRAANAPTERVRGSAVAQSHGPAYRPPSRSVPVSQADEIRRYALENYVMPWRESGNETLAIRAGDVEREMALRQATPNVCSALEGRKFQDQANLVLVCREGPRRSTTTTYYYRQS